MASIAPAPSPPGSSAATVSWRTLLLAGLGLGLVVLLAYGNSFSAGLTLDNTVIIGRDPRIRAWTLHNLGLILTENYWWPYAASDLYRPLTTLSYLFNYAVLGNGVHVAGYHWINFVLHWANAWLVLVVLHRLSGRLRLSLLAAALFAVHPVNVESVTNIVGRADLLVTGFILAGGWCYLRAAAAKGLRRFAWLAGVLLASCLGVLAKENAVMIAAFVLLYDWLWRWPRLPGDSRGARLRAALREFVLKGWIVLGPSLALLWWTYHRVLQVTPVYGQYFVDNPIAHAGFLQGFLTAVGVLGRYLGLLVLPATLSCDYSYNQIPLFGEGAHWWQAFYVWLSLAVVAGLLWTAVRHRRRHVLYAWGVLFFFLMLLPVSNLVVPIGSIMAERFLYLPSIGFCLVAALALVPAGRALARAALPESRWRGLAGLAVPVLAVTALAVRTQIRNADWHSELTLWKSAVAAAPDSFKTHKGYANALWDAGHDESAVDAAIAQARLGLAVLDAKPLSPDRRDDTLFFDLGRYYRLKGDFLIRRNEPAAAAHFFRQAVAILERARAVDRWANEAAHRAEVRRGRKPGDLADVGNYRIYLELGLARLRLGDWARAEAAGLHAQRLAPGQGQAYLIAGVARLQMRRQDAAAVQLLASLILQPDEPDAWSNLARCYEALGLVPVPIVKRGKGYSLDDQSPFVRRELVDACRTLLRNYQTARLPSGVRTVRELATRKFNLSAAELAEPSS